MWDAVQSAVRKTNPPKAFNTEELKMGTSTGERLRRPWEPLTQLRDQQQLEPPFFRPWAGGTKRSGFPGVQS